MYDYWYRIVLFGATEFAKAELRENYTENLFDADNKMTIGVEFAVKNIEIDETKVKFDIWDLSSEERFKTFIPNYVLSTSGAILIIRMYDDLQLSELRQKVLGAKTTLSHVNNGPIPIVVLGIQDDIDVKQPKFQSENSTIAKIIGVDIFHICRIKDKEVIESVFQELGHILVNKTLAENRKIDYESHRVAPEESSILFDRIVGIGIAIMVIVVAIVFLYVAYLRNL